MPCYLWAWKPSPFANSYYETPVELNDNSIVSRCLPQPSTPSVLAPCSHYFGVFILFYLVCLIETTTNTKGCVLLAYGQPT